MAKKVNTTMIGLFVISACAIFLGSLLLFGSGKWFKPISKYVVYFPESVQGLNVGAPVKFRGVSVGEVTNVEALYFAAENKIVIPVYLEVDRARIKNLVPAAPDVSTQQANLLKSNLKAQLIMESFVTGQRSVAVDIRPDVEPRLFKIDQTVPEIPSMASSLERVSSELESLPISEIAQKLNRTLSAIEAAVTTPEFGEGVKSIGPIMLDVKKLVENASEDLPPIFKDLRSEVDELDLKLISEKLVASLTELEQALKAISDQNSPLLRNSNKALNEISAAAKEFRQLAELLQRQPEAILSGKK